MTIKAIGFDLDDTLYSHYDFYKNIFDVMESSIINSGVSFSKFYEILQYYSIIEYKKFINREKSRDEYKIDRVIRTYKTLGKDVSESEAVIFNALYLYFKDSIKVRDGLIELLEKLSEHNTVELFILTNGPSNDQRRKLNQLNISHLIDKSKWFISDELGYSKPDINIFKEVEKKIGYLNKDILYIGDSYENDILGAREAGWNTIYLNTKNDNEVLNDIISIKNISEIIEYIEL